MTQAQYYKVMNKKPSLNRPFTGWENLPVDYVNWYEAAAFCNALSELEGLEPYYDIDGFEGSDVTIAYEDGKGYRLPTEAEWEYAARGGKNGDHSLEYAGSDNIGLVAWYGENSSETKRVGAKDANDLGLYDMSGNVFEWCWDRYSSSIYTSGDRTDPMGSTASAGSYDRVYRGGSYIFNANSCRVTNRNGISSSSSGVHGDFGLRVVRFQ